VGSCQASSPLFVRNSPRPSKLSFLFLGSVDLSLFLPKPNEKYYLGTRERGKLSSSVEMYSERSLPSLNVFFVDLARCAAALLKHAVEMDRLLNTRTARPCAHRGARAQAVPLRQRDLVTYGRKFLVSHVRDFGNVPQACRESLLLPWRGHDSHPTPPLGSRLTRLT